MNDDRISEVYKGEIWTTEAQERARRRVNWICSQARGNTVLDLGCSQGIASIILGREGFNVVGVDVQASRIEYAQADLDNETPEVRSRVRFLIGEGQHLPFEDASFDTVLLGELIEHVAVPERILQEVLRVLRPGGRAVITTPYGVLHHHDHKHTYYPRDLVDLLGDFFRFESVGIEDRYFRIVGVNSTDAGFDRDEAYWRLATDADRAVRNIQEELAEARTRLLRSETKLAELLGVAQRAEKSQAQLLQARDFLRDIVEEKEKLRQRALELGNRVKLLEERIKTQDKDVHPLRSELSSAQTRTQALEARIAKLEVDRWKLRNRLAVSQWKLRSLTNRRWWRLGTLLGELRRRPWLVVPVGAKAFRLLSGRSERLPRPVPLPRPEPRARAEPAATLPPAITATPLVVAAAPGQTSPGSTAFTVPTIHQPAPIPRRMIPVAVILDDASRRDFEHEWQQTPLTPETWCQVLEEERPVLLFVQASASLGGAWRGKLSSVTGLGIDFIHMLTAFKEGGVPTVFWADLDPGEYDSFLDSARLFDVVFTPEPSMVDRYRGDLGHDRVGWLGPSVQPRVFNPNQAGERANEVFYLAKGSQEISRLSPVLEAARPLGLRIFSAAGEDGWRWPERYSAALAGILDADQQAVAPRTFKVGIAPESEQARVANPDLLRLAATKTAIVAPTSDLITSVFGSSVLQAGSEAEARNALRSLLQSEDLRTRIAHRAARAVFRGHTTSHRVAAVLAAANVPNPLVPPTVSVMAPTNRPDRIPNIIANCARQTWQPDEIVLVLHGIEVDEGRVKDEAAAVGIDSVNVLRQPAEVILGEVFNAGFLASSGDYIAKMDDDDYYGAEYLADLIDAFNYTEAEVVGKWAHYAYLEGIDATILRYGDFEHTYHDVLAISTLLIKRRIFEHHRFPAMPVGSGSVFLRNVRADGARIYSADRFNYLYNRYSAGGHHTFPVSDLQLASNSVVVCQGRNLDHVNA